MTLRFAHNNQPIETVSPPEYLTLEAEFIAIDSGKVVEVVNSFGQSDDSRECPLCYQPISRIEGYVHRECHMQEQALADASSQIIQREVAA